MPFQPRPIVEAPRNLGVFSRKLRLLLSVLAIVVGVTFASGGQVLTETLAKANAAATRTELTTIDVRVTAKTPSGGGQATVTADVLDTVRAIPGVSRADGRVRADGAKVVGSNGKVVAAPGAARYGTNWIGATDLVRLREGAGISPRPQRRCRLGPGG